MSRAEAHSHAERWNQHSLHAVHALEEQLKAMEADVVELIRQRDEAVEQRDHARDLAASLEADAQEAVDLLEDCAGQFMWAEDDTPDDLNHSFMSTGEHLSEYLARMRPHRWTLTPTGVRFSPNEISDVYTDEAV